MGLDAGPTPLGAGTPDLLVGGPLTTFLVLLDANGVGNFVGQTPPPTPATTSLLAFVHALTLDANGNVIATNPTQVLFTP